MTRTILTKTTAPGGYPSLQPAANSLDITFTAADVGNDNRFVASGKDLILAWNTGAQAYTVTLTSIEDEKKRTGNIAAYSIGAGEIAVIGPVPNDGWLQSDGYIWLSASNALIFFAVIALP
jgi:predicted secreted hydrolase